MKRLLALEIAKLWPSRELRVSLTVYALLVAGAVLSLRAFAFELPGGGAQLSLLAFPDVWHNAAYVAGWIDYLLYMVALQSITHEYQFRTNRQNVIGGLSRGQYVGGKILVMIVLAVLSTALVGAIAAGFGWWTGPAAADAGRSGSAAFVLLYLLQTLGYLMLAMLTGTIMRRTGLAVLAFIGYTLVAEPLLCSFVLPGAARWLPASALAALVPNPFFGYAGMRITASPLRAAIVSAAYVLIFAGATRWVFARQDL